VPSQTYEPEINNTLYISCTLKKVTGQVAFYVPGPAVIKPEVNNILYMGCTLKKVTGQDEYQWIGQPAYCESGPSAICVLGHTTEKEAGQAVSYVDWPGIAGTLSAPMRQVWLVRYICVRVTDSCHSIALHIWDQYRSSFWVAGASQWVVPTRS